MSPLPKLFGKKGGKSSRDTTFHYDLERGQNFTPPLPSSVYTNPSMPASMPRESYSAPPSVNPMATVGAPAPPPKIFDPERYRDALETIEGRSPLSRSRLFVPSPRRPGRGGPLFATVEDEPELERSVPAIPLDSPGIPLLPAKAYVPPSKLPIGWCGSAIDGHERGRPADNEGKTSRHGPAPISRGQSNQTIQDGEFFEDIDAYEREDEEDPIRETGFQEHPSNVNSQRMIPTASFVPNPDSTQLGEYAWSPAPSANGDEEDDNEIRLYRSISSTDLSWLVGSEEDTKEMQEVASSARSISPSDYAVTDPTPPVISTSIPAGNLNIDTLSDFGVSSSRGNQDDQYSSRFSVVMADGTSTRPMSVAELEQSLNSIEAIIKSGMTTNQSESSGQSGVMAAFGDHESAYLRDTSESTNNPGLYPDAGPGSSQTPSSRSTDRIMGIQSGRQGRIGFYLDMSSPGDDASSQRVRSPTPPLLYGRRAKAITEQSLQLEDISRPVLARDNSRLGKAMQANGVRKDGRLAKAYPVGSGDQDWETISDMKELGSQLTGNFMAEAPTGSSLADNSDSGSLSLPKQQRPSRQLPFSNRVLQHPAPLRHNQQFLLVKDNRTGQTYSLPQSEFGSGGRVPSANANSDLSLRVQARQYQHPTPFTKAHGHPFRSSPPRVFAASDSPNNVASTKSFTDSTLVKPKSLSSEMSDEVQKTRDPHVHESIYEITNPVSDGLDSEVGESQRQLGPKERSQHSSAWVSTTSEHESALSGLPNQGGSFAKVSTLGYNGNVTGTPEGTGAREVGSSLADGSSSGAKLSSPAPFSSSPHPQYNTPSKASALQTNMSSIAPTPSSTTSTTTHNYSDDNNMENWPKEEWWKWIPPQRRIPRGNVNDSIEHDGLQQPNTLTPTRCRSSSESEAKIMAPKPAGQAFALGTPVSRRHEKSLTSTAFLLGQNGSSSRDSGIRSDENQCNVRERRPRLAQTDERATSTTTTSTASTPVRDHHGRVFTDTPPPEFIHPVYGRNYPWDAPDISERTKYDCGRQSIRTRPAVRPVARVESPHLFRTPYVRALESIGHGKKLAFWLTIAFCVVPCFAIIPCSRFGDIAVDWISRGEVECVPSGHKRAAGVVFVVGTPLLIAVIMLIVYFLALAA